DVNVGSRERIRIGCLIERAIVARQADAKVAMVECVVGVRAELQGEAFRKFRAFEDGHVPDVQARRIYDVPAGVGLRAGTGLHEPGSRNLSHISDDMRVAGAGWRARRNNAGCSTGTVVAN